VSVAGTGSVLQAIALAGGNPTELLSTPGSQVVWLPAGDSLVSVDLASGEELAPIALPTAFGPAVYGVIGTDRLYALHAIQGASAPFALAELAKVMRLGPGPIPSALHVLVPAAQTVLQYHPGTLSFVSSSVLPAAANMMALSSGGTEWLLVGSGSPGIPGGTPVPGTWMRLPVGSPLALVVAVLPAESQSALTVLPSALPHTAISVSGGATLL
jgi:hypothetical protein